MDNEGIVIALRVALLVLLLASPIGILVAISTCFYTKSGEVHQPGTHPAWVGRGYVHQEETFHCQAMLNSNTKWPGNGTRGLEMKHVNCEKAASAEVVVGVGKV